MQPLAGDAALQQKSSLVQPFLPDRPALFLPDPSALVPLLCRRTGPTQMNERAAFSHAGQLSV